jgi:hypothetical protein
MLGFYANPIPNPNDQFGISLKNARSLRDTYYTSHGWDCKHSKIERISMFYESRVGLEKILKLNGLPVPVYILQYFSLTDNAALKHLHPIREFTISEPKASDHQPVPQVSAKFVDPPCKSKILKSHSIQPPATIAEAAVAETTAASAAAAVEASVRAIGDLGGLNDFSELQSLIGSAAEELRPSLTFPDRCRVIGTTGSKRSR